MKTGKRKKNWARMKKGKLVPSRFSGGSYDALEHSPTSLKKPNSFYNRVIAVTADNRANGKAYQDVHQITKQFNRKFKPKPKKRFMTVGKVLSRLAMWQIVDYDEKHGDARGGRWALKADIDITDIDDLFLRAESARKMLENNKTQDVIGANNQQFSVIRQPKAMQFLKGDRYENF